MIVKVKVWGSICILDRIRLHRNTEMLLTKMLHIHFTLLSEDFVLHYLVLCLTPATLFSIKQFINS